MSTPTTIIGKAIFSGTQEEVDAEMARVRDEALARGSALGLYKLMPDGRVSFCHVLPIHWQRQKDDETT